MKNLHLPVLFFSLFASTLTAFSADPFQTATQSIADGPFDLTLPKTVTGGLAGNSKASPLPLTSFNPQVQRMIDDNLSPDERFLRIVTYLNGIEKRKGSIQAANEQAKIALELIHKYPQALSHYRWESPYQMLLEAAQRSEPTASRALVQKLLQYPVSQDIKWRAQTHLILLEQLGKPLEYRFTAIDGTVIDTRQLLGKVILACFWWGTDPNETAEINKVYQQFHLQGFEVLSMCAEKNEAVLKDFAIRNNIHWPICSNQSRELEHNCSGITWWPQYILLDKLGNLADYQARNELEIKVRKLLN